jgi:hypothetical protein
MRVKFNTIILALYVASQGMAQEAGTIKGKVVDQAGQPVAEVSIYLSEVGRTAAPRAFGLSRFPRARSNSNGEFVINNIPTGAYQISWAKREEGYADTRLGFYSLALPIVTLTEGPVGASVTIQMPPKAGVISGASITDAETGKDITLSATLTLRRADHPEYFITTSARLGDLPVPAATDVAVEIQASGYRTWPPRGGPQEGRIRLEPEEHMDLDVRLEKDPGATLAAATAPDGVLYDIPREYSFQPEGQKPISLTTNATNLTMRATKCAAGAPGNCFSVRVEDKKTDGAKDFALANATAQIDRLAIAGSKLVVMGHVSATTEIFTIISLEDGHVLDSVLCLWPSISPDGKKLAYVQAAPSRPDGSAGERYMMYDLSVNTESAPTTGNGTGSPGIVMYTAAAKSRPSPGASGGGIEAHLRGSRWFWLSADRLAFVDISGGSRNLVTADLSAGMERMTTAVQPLDFSANLCSGNDSAQLERIWVSDIREVPVTGGAPSDGASGQLRLTLQPKGTCIVRGHERVTLQVRNTQGPAGK